MVIGVDAREADGYGGKARYVREMVSRLPRQAPDTQFTFYGTPVPGLALPDNSRWLETGGGPLWHWRTAKHANQHCDAFFSTVSYLTPQFLRIPFTQTVYDLVTFKDFAVPQRKARMIETRALPRMAERAYRIITISQATADDLTELVPAAADKTTAIPLAADARFGPRPKAALAAVRRKFGLANGFVFNTGTIEPRKNQARLIRAHAALPEKLRARYPLVLASRFGWDYGEVAAELQARPDVIHLEGIHDGDLADLYAAATVFCYPSLYEGFGLPVLEAMQSGSPVLTSSVSSLPEVGGRAVRYADPNDEKAISRALARLLSDLPARRRLATAGRKRAKSFSWEDTVKRTCEVIGVS